MNFINLNEIEDVEFFIEFNKVFTELYKMYTSRKDGYSTYISDFGSGNIMWKIYYEMKDEFLEEYPGGIDRNGMSLRQAAGLEFRLHSYHFFRFVDDGINQELITHNQFIKLKRNFHKRMDAVAYMLSISTGYVHEDHLKSVKRPDMEFVYKILKGEKNRIKSNNIRKVDGVMIDRVINRLQDKIQLMGIDILPDSMPVFTEDIHNKFLDGIFEDCIVRPKLFNKINK